jgi:hypothetical protein
VFAQIGNSLFGGLPPAAQLPSCGHQPEVNALAWGWARIDLDTGRRVWENVDHNR